MMGFPDDRRYSKEHEWAKVTGNVCQIGITEFAVEQLGDVTQVDLPEEGEELDQDQVFGTVESVKAVSDLFAPVGGKVIRTNQPVYDAPETLNESCYDEGWLIEVEMSDPSQLEELMDADAYKAFVDDLD